MAWFEKEMDYARENLTSASDSIIDRAGDRLDAIVSNASHEIDTKLDKISQELHDQRSLTKDDVHELIDYAAERMTGVIDQRILVMKAEISDLVQEKIEYFKAEIDDFFIRRQRDLARERQRLIINIALAFLASIAVGVVSLFYKGIDQIDMLSVFRIVLASLAGGYSVYLVVGMLRYWMNLAEHEKDIAYVAARYWGWLRPASVLSSFTLVLALGAISLALIFPDETLHLLRLQDWVNQHFTLPLKAMP